MSIQDYLGIGGLLITVGGIVVAGIIGWKKTPSSSNLDNAKTIQILSDTVGENTKKLKEQTEAYDHKIDELRKRVEYLESLPSKTFQVKMTFQITPEPKVTNAEISEVVQL